METLLQFTTPIETLYFSHDLFYNKQANKPYEGGFYEPEENLCYSKR